MPNLTLNIETTCNLPEFVKLSKTENHGEELLNYEDKRGGGGRCYHCYGVNSFYNPYEQEIIFMLTGFFS